MLYRALLVKMHSVPVLTTIHCNYADTTGVHCCFSALSTCCQILLVQWVITE